MRFNRAMIVLSVMVVVAAAVGCCKFEPCPEPITTVVTEPQPESRYVVITYTSDVKDVCEVFPFTRETQEKARLTWVNLTGCRVTLGFPDSLKFEQAGPYLIETEEALTLKLKKPDEEGAFDYSITTDCGDMEPCYTEPIPGPFVRVP